MFEVKLISVIGWVLSRFLPFAFLCSWGRVRLSECGLTLVNCGAILSIQPAVIAVVPDDAGNNLEFSCSFPNYTPGVSRSSFIAISSVCAEEKLKS